MMGPVNVSAVKAAHASLFSGLQQVLDAETEDAIDQAKQRVWQSNDFKHITRFLARSTRGKVIRTRSGRVIKIQNTAKYAHAINSGSRPHIIRGRRGKMLRFVSGGQVIFRRQVMHPGTQPTLFLKRATEHAFIHFTRGTTRKLSRLAARFNRARA